MGVETGGAIPPVTVRAAQYVRMSTEHQKYSTENQAAAMQQYAARRGLEIVRTYADEGKSGLRLDGRGALKQLIEDVQSGGADFGTILVYDVSRWGRFQDADESAYYEYICRRSGIPARKLWPSPEPGRTRSGRADRRVAYGCLISRSRGSGWVSQRAVRDLLAVQRSPACLYKLNEIGFACLKCGIG
jgi:hypothetical protein